MAFLPGSSWPTPGPRPWQPPGHQSTSPRVAFWSPLECLLLASWSTLLPILLVQCRLLDSSLLPLESPPAGPLVCLPAPPASAVPGHLHLKRVLLASWLLLYSCCSTAVDPRPMLYSFYSSAIPGPPLYGSCSTALALQLSLYSPRSTASCSQLPGQLSAWPTSRWPPS